MADVFRSDLFSTTSLTLAINVEPYVPQYLSKLGLFEEDGVETTTVVIEKQGTVLTLMPTKARGAPGTPIAGDKRSGYSFAIPHIPASAQVHADEIQNVRQFGSANQLTGLKQKRDEKIRKMSRNLDLTLEYHRLGAVQGLVLDSDGSTLFDLYTEFNVSARTEVDLNLDATYDPNNPAVAGAVRKAVTQVKRDMQEDLDGNEPTGCLVLCSDEGWDALISAPEIRNTYLNQQEAKELRQKDGREEFVFAGCLWTNYRGTGSVKVPANKFRFVPLGVPGLFITRFAPANYMETVNTTGLPKYVKAAPDPSGFDKFVELEAQSNPLNLCTRPRALRLAKIT